MSTKQPTKREILRNYGVHRLGCYIFKGVLHIFSDEIDKNNEKIISEALNLPTLCINGNMYSNQNEPP